MGEADPLLDPPTRPKSSEGVEMALVGTGIPLVKGILPSANGETGNSGIGAVALGSGIAPVSLGLSTLSLVSNGKP